METPGCVYVRACAQHLTALGHCRRRTACNKYIPLSANVAWNDDSASCCVFLFLLFLFFFIFISFFVAPVANQSIFEIHHIANRNCVSRFDLTEPGCQQVLEC